MDPHPATEAKEGPLPSRTDVLHCQISSWYPTFWKLPPNALHRTKGTIQTIFIDLPDSFRDYLVSDGIQLPKGAKTSSLLPSETVVDSKWSSDDDNEEAELAATTLDTVSQQEDQDDSSSPTLFSFPELDQQIAAAIQELGGSVAPKLNWSAPKDAIWMNSGTLRCQTPGDIYLLLKASDFCSYDVHHALTDVADDPEESTSSSSEALLPHFRLQLALRKWCNLYPSQEFRCFVKEHELVAISQRQDSQHFPHLSRDAFMIRSLIVEFFDEVLQYKVARQQDDSDKAAAAAVSRYIFDCYVDQKEKVWIIDFNVWGRRTDTLLFDWDELERMDSDMPEIRVVETEKQVRSDPLASYRAPVDAIHVASLTGGDPKAFETFMKMCRQSSDLDDDADNQTNGDKEVDDE